MQPSNGAEPVLTMNVVETTTATTTTPATTTTAETIPSEREDPRRTLQALAQLARQQQNLGIEPVVLSMNAKSPPPLKRTVTIASLAKRSIAVHWSYLGWISFMSFVGGCLNGVSLSGVFDSPSTHMTGMSSNMVIRWLKPPKTNDVRGPSISGWWYLLFMSSFVGGCLLAGAVMVERDRDEHGVILASKPPRQLTMDSPKLHRWKTTHQILLTVEMGLLLLGLVIIQFVNEGVVDSIDARQQFNRFLMSLCLVCCAAGIHNSLTTYCRTLAIRSTHVTGTLTDIGLIIGFALRTKQRQHLWKLRLLIASWVSYCCGVCLGAVSYYGIDDYALFVPILLLSPLFLWGLWSTNFYGMRFQWVRRVGGLNTPQIGFSSFDEL